MPLRTDAQLARRHLSPFLQRQSQQVAIAYVDVTQSGEFRHRPGRVLWSGCFDHGSRYRRGLDLQGPEETRLILGMGQLGAGQIDVSGGRKSSSTHGLISWHDHPVCGDKLQSYRSDEGSAVASDLTDIEREGIIAAYLLLAVASKNTVLYSIAGFERADRCDPIGIIALFIV